MKALGVIIAFALVTGCSHLNTHPRSLFHRFSSDALTTDFSLIRSALEEAHPGLYDFRSRAEMDALFDRLQSELSRDMTELEFLQRIAVLNGAIGCGHTAIVPSLGTRNQLMSTAGLFPGDIRIVDARMFLLRCYAPGSEALDGSEILAVNGSPAGMLLERFLDVLPSDGVNVTHRYRMLDERMRYYYAAFVGTPETFEIRLRRPDGAEQTVTVPAMAEHAMRTHARYMDPDREDPEPYALEISEDTSTAVLTIRTFGMTDRYESFLADAFGKLRDHAIRNLIIDLRGNGGGEDEYGAKLVSYLIDQPFRYYRSLETRTDRIHFQEYTDITPEEVREYQSILEPGTDGGFQVAIGQHPCLSEIPPTEPVFRGRVLVLIDGGSFSATSEVSAVLDHLGRAEFAGEETGGRYDGNNSGYMPTLTLPATGIRVFIPLMKYVVAVDDPPIRGRGVMPDYTIEPSLSDEMTGMDRVMNEARAIVARTE